MTDRRDSLGGTYVPVTTRQYYVVNSRSSNVYKRLSNRVTNTRFPTRLPRNSNCRVAGAGWATTAAAAATTTGSFYTSPTGGTRIAMQTINKPDSSYPDSFPAVWYSLGTQLVPLNAVRPFTRTGVANYYGASSVTASSRQPHLKVYAASSLPSSILPFLDTSLQVDAGNYQEAYLLTRTPVVNYGQTITHYDSSFIDPQPVAFVYQAVDHYARYNRIGTCTIDSAGVVGSGGLPLSIANSNVTPRVVVHQSGRVLMSPLPAKYVMSSPERQINVDPDSSGAYYKTLYRGNTQSTYPYSEFYQITNELTWLDITDFPTVTYADLDMTNDGPPALVGIGYMFDALYGQNYAANGKGYGVSVDEASLDLVYRITDTDVRRAYNAMMRDGGGTTTEYPVDGSSGRFDVVIEDP